MFARVNIKQGYNKDYMKLADRIKIISEYFESLGMKVKYADKVIVAYRDDDGIYRNKETESIRFEVEYEIWYYTYGDKKWHKDTTLLGIDILVNGLWMIETVTTDEDVILGYFTEEVAKIILETLVKRKTV